MTELEEAIKNDSNGQWLHKQLLFLEKCEKNIALEMTQMDAHKTPKIAFKKLKHFKLAIGATREVLKQLKVIYHPHLPANTAPKGFRREEKSSHRPFLHFFA